MMSIPQLHLISNREICPIDLLPDVVAAAVAGGVDAVHLREPGLDDETLRALAERISGMRNRDRFSVFINRSLETAQSVNADGVHLAEKQIHELGRARDLLPAGSIVGVSIHSVESALAAAGVGADYLIAGHVFETGSKPRHAGRGLEFIEHVCSAVSIPVIAIGGITPGNTRDVLNSGACGIAILSGILASADPESAAKQYKNVIYQVQDGQA